MGSKRSIVFLVGLFVLGFALWEMYGRVDDSPFIYDDALSLGDNPSIVRLWPLLGDAEQPGPLNPPKDLPTSGRPLVNLSLALNYHFGGLNPRGYHLFNLVVHLLSALLLMAIVDRLLRLDYFGGRFDAVAGWLALAAALLWAVHPLQTETVVYVTQRTELLVGFFYLSTLYGSLRYWEAGSPRGRATWLGLATIACLAGMASKEVMVTAPVVVLLLERTFVAGSFRQALRKSWPLYLGLALGWILLAALSFAGPRSGSAGFHLGVAATDWWLTQPKVLWMYLKLVVWPWPLLIHYEMPYLTTVAAAWPWLLATALFGIATLVLLWWHNPIGFAGASVFLILSPTLVVPVLTEVAAERRMYLPLAAIATLLVAGAYSLAQSIMGEFANESNGGKPARRRSIGIVLATGTALAVVLGVVSVHRLEAYENELTLWQDELKYQPDSSVAHNNLAGLLNKLGRSREAIEHCQEALRLNPSSAEALNNLGNALLAEGKFAQAIGQYQQSIQLNPGYAMAHDNLGVALLHIGKPQEAIAEHEEALRLRPNFVDAQNNLGVALMNSGRPAEAIEHYGAVLKSKPDSVATYVNLTLAYAKMQNSAEAIAAAKKALELARAHHQTGMVQEIEKWLANYQTQATGPSGAAAPASPIPESP